MAKLEINHVFYLKNRGIVFVGELLEGNFSLGDLISFQYENTLYRSNIIGIEFPHFSNLAKMKEMRTTKGILVQQISLFEQVNFDKTLLKNQIAEIINQP